MENEIHGPPFISSLLAASLWLLGRIPQMPAAPLLVEFLWNHYAPQQVVLILSGVEMECSVGNACLIFHGDPEGWALAGGQFSRSEE
jgi:hypothetical protein